MNQEYVDTVRLLLAVAPAVFRSPRFALKGGTALNLFVQDMPRLSIDLDVVFTDHTLDREAALRAIATELKRIKAEILRMGYRAQLPTSKSGDEVKLIIEGNGVQVKVEVNSSFAARYCRSRNGPSYQSRKNYSPPKSRFRCSTPQSYTAASWSRRWIANIHATYSMC
jgi:hypothetical protein